MLIVMCITVSLFGIFLYNHLSNLYKKNPKDRFLYLYLLIGLPFGMQHYSIFFNNETIENWFFIFPTQDLVINGLLTSLSLIFLILHTLTLPPSKLTLYYKVILSILKEKESK
ncbi:hypothetical protein [Photobacterium arenosum]|uniref:hypothetical protein n=1 Tax=Photobacterium arenosum TaxID=2774143 RepID=UPI00288B834E|nr:hypothetical protein [Photobacterium arenosum]